MDIIDAIILGIIQGLTEFLPVSSSGHLELAKGILGLELAKESIMITVLLHFGTALSTVVIFYKDIWNILKNLRLEFKNNSLQFILKIIISMVPAALIGILFDDVIDSFFNQQYILVGFMLILTGVLLFFANKAKSTDKDVTIFDSILVGIAQAIAITPGISRSGATISTSVILGVDKQKSAQFSFLMVVPLIFGKMAKDLLDDEFTVDPNQHFVYFISFITAFIVGLIACKWMISIVRKSKLIYFSIYCFIVGSGAIIYTLLS